TVGVVSLVYAECYGSVKPCLRCAADRTRPIGAGKSFCLTKSEGDCKHCCMTHVVSLRLPLDTVAALDRRAADSGLDRTKYILRLVRADLALPKPQGKRRFASTHLIGKFRSRGSSNEKVRAAVKAQCDKDR